MSIAKGGAPPQGRMSWRTVKRAAPSVYHARSGPASPAAACGGTPATKETAGEYRRPPSERGGRGVAGVGGRDPITPVGKSTHPHRHAGPFAAGAAAPNPGAAHPASESGRDRSWRVAAGRALTPERHARRTGWAAQATGEGPACAGTERTQATGRGQRRQPLGGQRKQQEEGQAPNYSLNVDFSVIVACNYSLKPDI